MSEYSKINELHIDLFLSRKFPMDLSKKLNIIVMREEKGYLIVATSNSNNTIILEYLKQFYNYPVKFIQSDIVLLNNLRHRIYKDEIIGDINYDNESDTKNKLDSIISLAIREKASDIHFEPINLKVRIRFRIDGRLFIYDEINLEEYNFLIMRLKVLCDLNSTETRLPQDGRMEFNYENRKIDLRISVIPLIDSEKVVIRILDKTGFIFKKENLGLNERDLNLLSEIINKDSGIILLTGPAGSGKTTTLYTILNELNDNNKNIISIEDPVEYKFEGINQSQVKNSIGYDFELALESILRQDPDIIMLGEIRSPKVAEIAIRSAITGHLMLSTLHTKNGISALLRLLSLGVEKDLLLSSILAIISQRLIRKLCFNCRIPYKASIEQKKELNLDLKKDYIFYKSDSCEKCRDGFKGRQLIIEILNFNLKLKEELNNIKNVNDMEKLYNKLDINNLLHSAVYHLLEGNIIYEDLISMNI